MNYKNDTYKNIKAGDPVYRFHSGHNCVVSGKVLSKGPDFVVVFWSNTYNNRRQVCTLNDDKNYEIHDKAYTLPGLATAEVIKETKASIQYHKDLIRSYEATLRTIREGSCPTKDILGNSVGVNS